MKVSKCMIGLAMLLAISGCATISQKPEVFKVKTLAVISVYVNSEVGDVENRKVESPTLTLLHFSLNDTDRVKEEALAGFAEKSAEDSLASVPHWSVVPLQQVLANPAYSAMKADIAAAFQSGQHLETGVGPAKGGNPDHFVPAPGMAFVPTAAIPTGGLSITVTGDGKTISQDDVKHYWGKLAADLGVDAVAIVSIDLAYKKNFFSGVHIPLVLASADANVDAGIVAVTKEGSLVLNSRGLTGHRVAGGGAPMLIGGDAFSLGDDKNEAVKEFERIIRVKLQQIAQQLTEELKASG